MIRKKVRIRNELGLHARAAARLVQLASRFESEMKLSRSNSNDEIDGKSILGILLLGAGKGAELVVTVDGSDEKAALEAVVDLINRKFDEEK